jgi:methylmalonyl-CoA decarboxylase subunit alpha
MGSKAAVDVIHARELRAAATPDERRNALIAEYELQLMSPYLCAEQGHVDDIIDPADTRQVLIRTLKVLHDKSDVGPTRKHGNVPL